MNTLARIAQAVDTTDVIRGVLAHIGPGSSLFTVDHEFVGLVPVDGASDPVALAGPLRAAMLRAEPHFDGDRTWLPLPEREQTIFVVATDGTSAVDIDAAEALGALLNGHRNRFEDLERGRRRAEMVVAAELQWDLLPLRADVLGEYQVAGILEPAYEVAGDVFEYALCDGSLWAYSFDGMGHGLEATMASVLVLSAVRNARRQGGSLTDQMDLANDVLWSQYGGDRFVTGAACRVDADGRVEIINAGHEPVRVVSAGDVVRLDLDVDLPLGVAAEADYRNQNVTTLLPGDGLVMFSDGPSAQSAGGEFYGADRLDEMLAAKWSDVPLQTGHGVIDDLLEFMGDTHVDDDVTAVVIRRTTTDGSAP